MDVFAPEKMRINLRMLALEIGSAHNDGWTSASYKKQLVEMKWFLDDLINDLPHFQCEEEWEKERLIKVLSKEKA